MPNGIYPAHLSDSPMALTQVCNRKKKLLVSNLQDEISDDLRHFREWANIYCLKTDQGGLNNGF